MAYRDDRPLDEKLRALAGRPEEEAIAWWKQRFEQIASLPRPTARAGALVPEWRELAALPKAARLALTRARLLASMQLTPDQEHTVFEARDIGGRHAPEVAADDSAFIRDEVVPTLPADAQERVRARLESETSAPS